MWRYLAYISIIQCLSAIFIADSNAVDQSYLLTELELAREPSTLIFASYWGRHGDDVIDPDMLELWMNVLRRYSGSRLLLLDGTSTAEYRYQSQAHVLRTAAVATAAAAGINGSRLVIISPDRVSKHLLKDVSVDIIMDVRAEKGYTVGLDSIWSGVPTITLGGGSSIPIRAEESIASALGNEIGVTYSLKEYEDLLYRFASSSSDRPYRVDINRNVIFPTCQQALAEFDDKLLDKCFNMSRSYLDVISGEETLRAWKSHLQASPRPGTSHPVDYNESHIQQDLQKLTATKNASRIQVYRIVSSRSMVNDVRISQAAVIQSSSIISQPTKISEKISQDSQPIEQEEQGSISGSFSNRDDMLPDNLFEGAVLLNIGKLYYSLK
jgi:hypothetical protein